MSNRQEVLDSTDYEPYDNRVRPGQTNKWETLIHLIKGILGTGILALPDAFKNAGFIPGTVGSVVLTFLITYCLHILFSCMYYFCKRDKVAQITYPDAFKEGLKIGPRCLRIFANGAPFMVNFFIILYQTGCLCVYIIFCATNIKQIVDVHTEVKTHLGVETYMVFMLPFFVTICLIKNLKVLTPYSTVANWLTLLGLLVIYYFFFDHIGSMSDRNMFSPLGKMPLFIGTSMFAVLSIGPILSLELNIKDGRQWAPVLNIGMIVVTILNVFTGFAGYWKYGEQTQGVITLNLDINNIAAQVIRALFSGAIFISFALQAYPITEILWEQYILAYMNTSKHHTMWDYSARVIIVLLGFLGAVIVPHISLFISLFGAFCLSMLGIIFPVTLDICIRWPDDFGSGKIYLIRDIFLIIFGLFGWSIGSYIAIEGIVEKFINK